ncbi:MAG: tRNA pseudouridine(13) synthase TruD [Alkalimonas sp.]|nr:tRNA pseudouridine(13) synthase TruD [Alkalimonas sp.]
MKLPAFNWLYGEPVSTAKLRVQPEDFMVDEELNFSPSGAGEHLLLQIEKTGQNTQYVAKKLAELSGLKARDISFAGRKDRHAVTRQWFCLPWPIKQDIPWQDWQAEGYRIIDVQRHFRKLRLGALKRNHFQIRLREVTEPEQLWQRVQQVRAGVPNYYGEQRFGIDGGNLRLAESLFAGQGIADRQLRGLALSAARSFLFNVQLSKRIEQGYFQQLLLGDVVQLDGSGSIFRVEELTDALQQRLQQGDIHPTVALCGLPSSDKGQVSGQAARLEQQWLADYAALQQGLQDFRLKAERRAIRLQPQQLEIEQDAGTILLRFALPTGCFATSVLRELVCYQDCGRQV